jgi:hypothetical protein
MAQRSIPGGNIRPRLISVTVGVAIPRFGILSASPNLTHSGASHRDRTIAQRLVDYFWAEITAVAKALLERGKLTGREIRALTNEAQKEHASPRHRLVDYRALRWPKKYDIIEAFVAPEIPLLSPDDDDNTLIISLLPYFGQRSI